MNERRERVQTVMSYYNATKEFIFDKDNRFPNAVIFFMFIGGGSFALVRGVAFGPMELIIVGGSLLSVAIFYILMAAYAIYRKVNPRASRIPQSTAHAAKEEEKTKEAVNNNVPFLFSLPTYTSVKKTDSDSESPPPS